MDLIKEIIINCDHCCQGKERTMRKRKHKMGMEEGPNLDWIVIKSGNKSNNSISYSEQHVCAKMPFPKMAAIISFVPLLDPCHPTIRRMSLCSFPLNLNGPFCYCLDQNNEAKMILCDF